MKTLFFAAFLTFLTAGTVTAADPAYRLTSYGHTLVLNTANWNRADLLVQIQDQEGHVLTTQEYKSKEAGRLKRFNLAQLETGAYTITITDQVKTCTQEFALNEKSMTIHPEVKIFIKPFITLDESKLKVNFLNLGKSATLKILDLQQETIYQTQIDQPTFNKAYNLSNLAKGEYIVMVLQGDKYYSHHFELK